MGKTLKAIGRLALTVGGYVVAGPIGAVIGTAIGSVIFKIKPPRTPLAQLDRLNASLNPTAPRTGAFGETALGTDIRYIYPSGTDQRYIDYIIAVAAHKVESIDELWIEDRLAWSSSSGYAAWTNVSGARLTVATRTEGTSGNAINIGGAWTGSARLTGCAYIHIRIDRQGTKKTDSPFSGGLASRITIKGKGMPLYDPRLDTTRGGSGSHRADDQTTWATTTARNNPALQILAYLIGWKIGGKLSVGRGVPLDDIDFESFITAANTCDEDIDLSGGGTQNRYEAAGMFSEGDDADTILGALAASCNAELRDYNGRIGLFVKVNDLAVPVASFSDQNILSGFRSSTGQVSGIPNVVRGRYTDPSNNALYQLVDYPEVSISSPDGIERVLPLDLPYVQEGRRAQRIAKQALQRAQYPDTYEAEFDITALKCGTGDVVEISFEALGWTDKLFRVVSQSLTQDGRIAMQLRVEDASIYAWEEDETAPVTAAAPTTFDPLNAGAILAAANPLWDDVMGDGKPEDGATNDAPGNLLSGPQAANDPAAWGGSSAIWEHFENGPTSGWGSSVNPVCILAHLGATTAFSTHLIGDAFELGSTKRVYFSVRFAHGNAASIDLKVAIWFYDADDNYISGSLVSYDLPRTSVAGEYVNMQFAADAPVAGAVRARAGYWRDAGSASGEYILDQLVVTLAQQGADITRENDAGGLIAGSRILQNGAPAIQAGASPFEILVVDGDVIAFSPALAVTPKASFDLAALPALASGESYSVRAETLTGTGCTVRVKKRTSGGSVSTLSTGLGSVITTDLEYQVSKGDARDARDHVYKMRLKGQVRGVYQAGGGGGWFDYPIMLGGMTIEIFAKVSSAWQSCGVFSIAPPYGTTATTSFDETFTFTCANAIGDPAGNEFRALVTSRAFSTIDKLTELSGVGWQVDGTAVTETAVTQAVVMRIQPQNV